MLCIAIAQKSSALTRVDMFNAGPQCDLLEVRLDRLDRAADLAELLARKPRPVILSCRRAEDGGDWLGEEAERLALLRRCLDHLPDYLEIELDVAGHIPPKPPTRRVITYTNLVETPPDLAVIYKKALTHNPDVVKLVVPARTPEEVWPVVQLLAKPAAPTVVVGVGRPGIMLALLARKMGAPWVYAALERGLEAYFQQPTIHDLETVYHYRSIDRNTPFAGVTGFDELQYVTVALLNAAFANLEEPLRCLPLEIGDPLLFRKVLEAVKANSAVIDPRHQEAVREVVAEVKPSAQVAGGADFILHQEGRWQGHNLLCRAALAALERTLRANRQAEHPLQGRVVHFAGANGMAHVLAVGIRQAGGVPVLADHNWYTAESLARELGCQAILLDALAPLDRDVLVRCDDTPPEPGWVKGGPTVLDLRALPRISPWLETAAQAGCPVVSPQQVLVELVLRQARAMAGQDVSRELLQEKLKALLEE
jgi:3-dehydroquinate dehydratase/shikimate dehydrogenase